MIKGSKMGKDPSVSWVFNDWQGGTMILSRNQKGCYMDLLTAQFNHGHLTLENIKIVLSSDFETEWPALQQKFIMDEKGLYYNERLEFEIVKRQGYNQSRRDNFNKKRESLHMGIGKGIGNDNEKENIESSIPIFEHPLQEYTFALKNVSKLRDQLTVKQCESLIEKFGDKLVKTKLNAMENKKTLAKDYVSVFLTCKNWCEMQIDRDGPRQREKPISGKNYNTNDLP